MKYRLGDAELEVRAEHLEEGRLKVTLPSGEQHTVQARVLPSGDLEITEGDRCFVVAVVTGVRGAIHVGYDGGAWTFQSVAGRRAPAKERAGSLTAPMTGVVAKVLITEGERVEIYQALAVVEAMKVMATVEAPFAGIVRAVAVQPGDRVEHGAVLVELDALPSS